MQKVIPPDDLFFGLKRTTPDASKSVTVND